ncbi:Ribosome biogenesis protein Nop16 [Teratosphaeriaceae sp. CCFEE 6253]|nr:Ribosome biogenesis protein Nop16 [Teratosphaeriaceae sp. CCFEE 6253]
MGRELQKKKNKSGVSKARRKPKSKKLHLQNPIISANWDKTQTLEQNYKRLGLTSKLNKHTGGIERKAEDVERARDEAEDGAVKRKDDVLAIGSIRRSQTIDVQEARIERDPETGRILRVIESGQVKANPLNDPLNELDSEDEDDEGLNQHASANLAYYSGESTKTEVVRRLEMEASKPKATHKPKQSENERAFIVELMAKHGDDYGAMMRDTKINYMQRSAGDLKRRVKKWRESGGVIS